MTPTEQGQGGKQVNVNAAVDIHSSQIRVFGPLRFAASNLIAARAHFDLP